MHPSSRILIFCFFISFPLLSKGQGTGDSPFSQIGVGDLVYNNGDVRNAGMGYAGVSAKNYQYINFVNPALLPNMRNAKRPRLNHRYKQLYHFRNMTVDSTVKIDFGLNYQNRSIQVPGGFEKASGANVAYLVFALPMSKTWGASIGIVPYSTVNYNLAYTTNVSGKPGSTTDVSNTGKGGIYKIFWSNGVGITNCLSVGLETALMYGNINNQLFSTVTDLTTVNYGFKRQDNYSAFGFKPGLLYRREIVNVYHDTVGFETDSTGKPSHAVLKRKTKSSGVFYSIGLTYDFFSTMNITRTLNLYNLDATNHINLDTSIQTNKYKAHLPSTVRLGFSLDAPLRWTATADVFFSPWSNYKTGFSTDTLGNSYGFNVGGELTPNYQKPKSKTVRVGFTYVKTPVIYHGHQLDDMSFSVGGSMSLGRKRRDRAEELMMPVRPKLNFALVFGQRGNVTDFGIKEQYVKVYASFMIHHKWFDKRKIY